MTARRPSVPAPTSRLGIGLLTLGLVLYLTVSPQLLTALGIPYDLPVGSFVFKIHPGTYATLLAFPVLLAARGNPLRGLAQAASETPLPAVQIATCLFLIGYSASRYGPSGSAFIIDTLMMPPLCAFLLARLPSHIRSRYFLLIVGLVFLNALIGIGESLFQARIVPYTVAGADPQEDVFRSTALLGHPLTNAMITGPVIIAALALRLPMLVHTVLISLFCLGLLSFGGRTSFLLTTLCLTAFCCWRGIGNLLRGRYGYLQITGGLVFVFVALTVIVAAVPMLGLGERIFTHMQWDNSADVRRQIWRALDFMSPGDILFGIAPEQIKEIIYRLTVLYGLDTIENFWLLMLMQMGAIGLGFFIAGLICGAIHLWRHNSAPARLALALFFVVASSNNSLASKNSALTILFATLTCAAAYGRESKARRVEARTSPRPRRPGHRTAGSTESV